MAEIEEKDMLEIDPQENSVDVLMNDEDVAIISIDLFHIDNEYSSNLNDCRISKECAEVSLPTFANKPITFRYNSKFAGLVTDVTEHWRNQQELFDMRVAGHIPPDSRVKFIERANGKTYCNVEAIIQKRLVPKFMEIVKNNNGKMKVSVVFYAKGYKDDDGIFVIESFRLQEVTVLSPSALEGIEGSHFEVVKFSKDEMETANERYCVFSKQRELSTEGIFVKIKNKKKEEAILNSLTSEVLKRRLWHLLRNYKYSDGNWQGDRYWYEDVDTEKKVVIVHDNQTDELFAIPYKISKEGDVTINEEARKKVEKDENYRQVENACEFLFAKEDYGKGEEIKIDKSADAMSDTEWGKINKTTLRKEILDAKNYKELVDAAYLVVEDGWEDAPSQKLKYPVMEIKDGKLVYNRYGLASALTYAKANNEEDVVGKIEDLYKKLGIDSDKEEVENKLDKDNKDIEKIKDDADALEDDEKEKLRKEEENSADIVDKPAEEMLKDDVDADKDYWKKKYDEMKDQYDNVCENLKNANAELDKYHMAEQKVEMKNYLEEYKDAFSDDEMKVMASKIECFEMGCEDFKKAVDDKFITFLKNRYKEEKVQNSEVTSMASFENTNKKVAEFKTETHNGRMTDKEIIERLKNK